MTAASGANILKWFLIIFNNFLFKFFLQASKVSTRFSFQFCTLRRQLDRGQHVRICPHVASQPLEIHPSWHLPWVTQQWSPIPTSEPEIYMLIFELFSCDEPLVAHRVFAQPAFMCVSFAVIPRITSSCLSMLKTGSFRIIQIIEIMSGVSQTDYSWQQLTGKESKRILQIVFAEIKPRGLELTENIVSVSDYVIC